MSRPVLVVGAGGLLGSALMRRFRQDRREVRRAVAPWGRPNEAVEAIAAAVAALAQEGDEGYELAWCAGAGVTSSSAADLDVEESFVDEVVAALLERVPLTGARVFLASSAGGLYAGASSPPFSELTPPAPISAYGRLKLATERAFRRLADHGGARVLLGRISNLYGPGQDLAKSQGLISQLCRAQLTSQPVGVYVSLDTLRDYLFVDDAATKVADGLAGLDAVCVPGDVVVKVFASQRSDSIAEVLGEVRRVYRRRPQLLVQASPHSSGQTRDLRLRSVVWQELDARPVTPLPVGIHRTALALDAAIRAGRPAATALPAVADEVHLKGELGVGKASADERGPDSSRVVVPAPMRDFQRLRCKSAMQVVVDDKPTERVGDLAVVAGIHQESPEPVGDLPHAPEV